jgi:hypothetical protein
MSAFAIVVEGSSIYNFGIQICLSTVGNFWVRHSQTGVDRAPTTGVPVLRSAHPVFASVRVATRLPPLLDVRPHRRTRPRGRRRHHHAPLPRMPRLGKRAHAPVRPPPAPTLASLARTPLLLQPCFASKGSRSLAPIWRGHPHTRVPSLVAIRHWSSPFQTFTTCYYQHHPSSPTALHDPTQSPCAICCPASATASPEHELQWPPPPDSTVRARRQPSAPTEPANRV